jgi:N-succinyldiaminopimelate aminotransferase
VRLNPAVAESPGYPLHRVAEFRRQALKRPGDLLDLSLGQPTEPVPAGIRAAIAAAVDPASLTLYPQPGGTAELREAIAGWLRRRFGAAVDPEREVLPTLGAKEPIATLARIFAGPADRISVATPSYPVAERSARLAGRDVAAQVLSSAGAWLPDPEAIPWGDVSVVWLVNPHNPTGAVASSDLLAELAERCRGSGAILAVDETYSEFWFGASAPSSALELEDRGGVVVFNSLSKRSGLAGLRSGFAAGDARIIARLRELRRDVGTTPPALVQRASAVAWEDDEHVAVTRERYSLRRRLLVEAASRSGFERAGGDAGLFVWLAVPGGEDEAAFEALLEHSLLTVPGSWLGAGGGGHLRLSITPATDHVAAAARVVEGATRSPRETAPARRA